MAAIVHNNGEPPTDSLGNPFTAPDLEHVPLAVAQSLTLASRGKRLSAVLLDLLTLLLISLPGLIMLTVGIMDKDQTWLNLSLLFLAGGFLAFALPTMALLASRQQTIGKMLMHIRIVRSNGETCSIWRIGMMRYLPMNLIALVPVLGHLVVLVDILMIFRDSSTCWHDDLADTIVIDLNAD